MTVANCRDFCKELGFFDAWKFERGLENRAIVWFLNRLFGLLLYITSSSPSRQIQKVIDTRRSDLLIFAINLLIISLPCKQITRPHPLTQILFLRRRGNKSSSPPSPSKNQSRATIPGFSHNASPTIGPSGLYPLPPPSPIPPRRSKESLPHSSTKSLSENQCHGLWPRRRYRHSAP